MSIEPCASKHRYTLLDAHGAVVATARHPKVCWVHWETQRERVVDVAVTHEDGAVCVAETRAVRVLLSGGPDPYEARTDATIGGLPARGAVGAADPDSATVIVGGTITTLQRKTTKLGNQWAVATVEDLKGSIDVLFFPNSYQLYAAQLAVGTVVLVTGRVERREDVPRLVALALTVPLTGSTGRTPVTEPTAGHGPYDFESQARKDSAPLAEAIQAVDPGFGPMTDAIRARRRQVRVDYLTAALAGAGVELGQLDRRIVTWLADWETETLQVLVGWIARAHRTEPPIVLTHCLTIGTTFSPSLCGATDGAGSFLHQFVTCTDCLTLLARRDGGA